MTMQPRTGRVVRQLGAQDDVQVPLAVVFRRVVIAFSSRSFAMVLPPGAGDSGHVPESVSIQEDCDRVEEGEISNSEICNPAFDLLHFLLEEVMRALHIIFLLVTAAALPVLGKENRTRPLLRHSPHSAPWRRRGPFRPMPQGLRRSGPGARPEPGRCGPALEERRAGAGGRLAAAPSREVLGRCRPEGRGACGCPPEGVPEPVERSDEGRARSDRRGMGGPG